MLPFDQGLKILFYVFCPVLQSFTVRRVVWYQLIYYIWNKEFSHCVHDILTWKFQRHFKWNVQRNFWFSFPKCCPVIQVEMQKLSFIPPSFSPPTSSESSRSLSISCIYASFLLNYLPGRPRYHAEIACQLIYLALASFSPNLSSHLV